MSTMSNMSVLKHWIGGCLDESPAERYASVTNPVDGAVIAKVPWGTPKEVDRAIADARTAWLGWRGTSLARRSQVMFALRALVARYQRDLAVSVVRDHGKTLGDAVGEVARGLEVIDYACGIPTHLIGTFSESVSTNVDTFSWRQPLGVIACITPFNFPVMVPMWMYPIALACGNAVVLKPSPATPSAIQLQAELLSEAGVPPGVFNVVYGGTEAVERLVMHPDVDAVSFVGSTEVGRRGLRDG